MREGFTSIEVTYEVIEVAVVVVAGRKR